MSSRSSSPLREPLLEVERPALPTTSSSGGGPGRIGSRKRGVKALKKYPLMYCCSVPLAALLPKEGDGTQTQQPQLALGEGAGGSLPVLRVEGSAAGSIRTEDRVTHVDSVRVRSVPEWEAAVQELRERRRRRPRAVIPGTEQQGEAEAGDGAVELRLLRRHHPYLEEGVVHPFHHHHSAPLRVSGLSSMAAPGSPPDSVLGLLLASGGCLLGAAAAAASSRSRASSWSSSGSGSDGDEAPCLQHQEEPGWGGWEADEDGYDDVLPPLPPYACWAHGAAAGAGAGGPAAALDAAMQRLPLAAFPFLWYEVGGAEEARAGLPALARRFGVSVDALRRDNRRHFKLGEPALVRPGLLLRLRNAEYDPCRRATAGGGCCARRWEQGASGAYCPPPAAAVEDNVEGLLLEETETEAVGCLDCGSGSGSGGSSQARRLLRGFHTVENGCSMASLTGAYGMAEAEIRRRNRHYFPTGVPSNEVLREGMLLKVEVVLRGEDAQPPAGFHAYHEEALPPAPAAGKSGCYCHVGVTKEYCCGVRRGSVAGTASLTSSSGSSSSGSSGSIYGSNGGAGRGRLFPLADVGAAGSPVAVAATGRHHHGFV